MPKYIDADKFLQDNAYFADRDFVNPKYDDTLRDLIDGAPAADVEPVVRCENCQFFENVEYWPNGTKKVCQLLKRQVEWNSFCCWGMKKEADDV